VSDRSYRLLFGLALLLALYFQVSYAVYALILLAVIEGLTNLRIPVIVTRLRSNLGTAQVPMQENLTVAPSRCKYSFEAERALRLLMAAILFVSFAVFPKYLWFVPWFIGFALFGAGVSGVCPSLSLLKWLGFR
jgi:hypothetical protein